MLQRIRTFLLSDTGLFFKVVIGSMLSQSMALAISMIGSVLLTRALGADGRGLVAWVTSLAMIVAAILQIGLGQANRCFVAEDKKRARELIHFNVAATLLLSLLFVPCFIVYAFYEPLSEGNLCLIVVGLMIAPAFALGTNLSELLLGLGRNKAFNVFLISQRSINSVCIVFLIVFGWMTPLSSVVMLTFSYYVQLLLTVWLLRSEIGCRSYSWSWITVHFKSYVAANYLSNLMMTFASTAVPILLASKHSLKAAGLYAACMILIDAARSSIRMVSLYTLPKVSGSEKPSLRKRYIKQSVKLTVLFGIVAAFLLYVSSDWLLVLLFGSEFADGAAVLRWLAVGLLFAVLYLTLQASLAAIAKGWVIVVPGVTLGITTFLAGYWLIPAYGALGGAWAFSGTFLVADIVVIGLLGTRKF